MSELNVIFGTSPLAQAAMRTLLKRGKLIKKVIAPKNARQKSLKMWK